MEFRLQEHYVDEVEYELAPKEKRPRLTHNPHQPGIITATAILHSGGEDTGAEADNEKSEYETEGDNNNAKLSIAKESNNNSAAVTQNTNNAVVVAGEEGGDATAPGGGAMPATKTATTTGPTSVTQQAYSSSTSNTKRKKVLVARPFAMMRGHTAFLTFATAGNKIHPDPNKKKIPSAGQQPKV